MNEYRNACGQPIGRPLPDWQSRRHPPKTLMNGRYCQVVPLSPEAHAESLWQVFGDDQADLNWTYLPYGPFETFDAYRNWLNTISAHDDPLFHAIVDLATAKPIGLVSYLRIEPSVGVIEVGHIHYSRTLQRTPVATEAMFLMMSRVFDELGYRRYEWKCDALNERSRAAAVRLGFSLEGIFRQATIYKGRNRDTAWYSIVDQDWPLLKQVFQDWLSPENYDAQGQQRKRLSKLVSRIKLRP